MSAMVKRSLDHQPCTECGAAMTTEAKLCPECQPIKYAPCGDPILAGVHDDWPCQACMSELTGPFGEN